MGKSTIDKWKIFQPATLDSRRFKAAIAAAQPGVAERQGAVDGAQKESTEGPGTFWHLWRWRTG